MMLRLSLAVFLVGLLGSTSWAETGRFLGTRDTSYPDWFKESFLELQEDVAEASDAGRRVMILFYQDDCPYCNGLVERSLAQQQIERKVRENLDVIALNIRGDREVYALDGNSYTEKRLANVLQVQFTPTLLFLDENARTILRLNGYLPPEQFEQAVDYVIGRHESEGDFHQYLARHQVSSSHRSLNTADFLQPPPFDLRRNADQPILVLFEQRQCPDCDRFHAKVLARAVTQQLLQGFYAVQIDMWSDTELVLPDGRAVTARDWAGELGVHYAPTVLLFDHSGNEIIRSESHLKAFHFQTLLDYVAGGAYRSEPEFQRYLTSRANSIRASGTDVDISH